MTATAWDPPLDAVAKKIGMRVEQVARGVKIKVFSQVVQNERVLSGRLAGNWIFSVDKPSEETIDRQFNGGAEKGRVVNKIESGARGTGTDWLSNNLPYAARWEREDQKIPTAIARVERNIREEVARVR